MARRKKTTGSDLPESVNAVQEPNVPPTIFEEPPAPIGEVIEQTGVSPAGAEPAATTAAQAAEPAKTQTPENRFHGVYIDRVRGYQNMQDKVKNLIVLKFDQQPDASIREQLKSSGFRYEPEYFGLKKVWLRRNDFEGRLQVEEIEARMLGQGKSAAAKR